MSEYKLVYFDLRGIGEPIRLLFKYLDVPFENVEVDSSDWENIKKGIKWGQLPYVEYNGKILTQSTAILNFVAENHNLVPDGAWKRAKCDEIMAAVHDLRLDLKPIVLANYIGDIEKAAKIKQEVLSGKVPLFLSNLNEILEEFHSDSGDSGDKTDFILGSEKPTAADFLLAHFTYQFIDILLNDPNFLDKYELLKKQQKAVFSLPRVAEHIASRPEAYI